MIDGESGFTMGPQREDDLKRGRHQSEMDVLVCDAGWVKEEEGAKEGRIARVDSIDSIG